MFTGIIAAVGRITEIVPESADPKAGVRLAVDPGSLDLTGVMIGDSIAIAGACMTVVGIEGGRLSFDVSRESLERTSGLDATGDVNLEKALRFGDRLDGHLVSGHVDGTGTVVRFEPAGESWTLVVRAPRALARFIALKGSIAVDGVSLTINAVDDHAWSRVGAAEGGCDFAINLIPHTVAVTTLKRLRIGDRVNLEIDTIARYVERMLATGVGVGDRDVRAPVFAEATEAIA
jgi:riboflavin synthase